jgi:hypothetical protein
MASNTDSSKTIIVEKSNTNECRKKAREILLTLYDWSILIFMSVLPGIINSYMVIYSINVGLGIIFMSINHHRHFVGSIKIFPKVFELGIFFTNVALLIFLGFVNPSHDWASKWVSLISDSSLCCLATLSILVGQPFTIQFAMEKVPESSWNTQAFLLTNTIISAVWALYFLLSVVFDVLYICVYPGNTIAKVSPGIVLFVCTMEFTVRYPVYLRTRRESREKLLSETSRIVEGSPVESPLSSVL